MKAEIKPSGNLKISSENELEAYALRVWAEGQQQFKNDIVTISDPTRVLIDHSFPVG